MAFILAGFKRNVCKVVWHHCQNQSGCCKDTEDEGDQKCLEKRYRQKCGQMASVQLKDDENGNIRQVVYTLINQAIKHRYEHTQSTYIAH